MCDTFVALPDATADGSLIFGKNSDREPNEAHELAIAPRSRHAPGSMVKLTYVEIPQVEETFFGPVRGSQSVGSMVSHLRPDGQTHWLSGASAPCTGIFKPVWLDAGLPDLGPAPAGEYDQATLWWRHEMLHRAVLRDYAARLAAYRQERDALEAGFIIAAEEYSGKPADERAAFSASCFSQAVGAAVRWAGQVEALQPQRRLPWHYALAWRGFDGQAGMPV